MQKTRQMIELSKLKDAPHNPPGRRMVAEVPDSRASVESDRRWR